MDGRRYYFNSFPPNNYNWVNPCKPSPSVKRRPSKATAAAAALVVVTPWHHCAKKDAKKHQIYFRNNGLGTVDLHLGQAKAIPIKRGGGWSCGFWEKVLLLLHFGGFLRSALSLSTILIAKFILCQLNNIHKKNTPRVIPCWVIIKT